MRLRKAVKALAAMNERHTSVRRMDDGIKEGRSGTLQGSRGS
jgi:hypothetical protein